MRKPTTEAELTEIAGLYAQPLLAFIKIEEIWTQEGKEMMVSTSRVMGHGHNQRIHSLTERSSLSEQG